MPRGDSFGPTASFRVLGPSVAKRDISPLRLTNPTPQVVLRVLPEESELALAQTTPRS